MSLRLRRLRPALAAALLLIVGLVSCGREVTGPGGRGTPATVALNPVFGTVTLAGTGEVLSIGSVVDFNRVRVVLLRTNGDTAVDELVPFPPESTTVRLAFNVTLGEGATSQGEPLAATLKYLNAAGDTVFSGGPIQVLARPSSNPGAAPDVPLDYTGPGANAASVTIAPATFVGTSNQNTTFSAVVRDAQNTVLANAPVAYTSTDSARVRVNIRTGATTLLGARGTALIIAQTLTGQADTADVTITPTPSAVVLVSGGTQNVRVGDPFPQPIRVRVNAVDGLPVSGVTVDFSVVAGGGSVTPLSAVTDANGEAAATWTAGTTVGVGTLRASIASNTIGVNVNGNQLSAAPASLQISASPSNFTAGDSIPPFRVIALDVTGDTVAGFSGQVSLALTGGTAGANIVGPTTVQAVEGYSLFVGVTIDRAGTGYRLVVQSPGLPSIQTAPFDVAAAPPRFVNVVAGSGQTAPASTALADSVRVRVTDRFGYVVPGVTVNFTVAVGGGTVSPTSRVTDAAGQAATSWTLGASGTQQITAGVTGINPVPVSATIFTGSGSPTLFMSAETVATTVGGSRNIPIFVNPAATSTVVAQLVTRDTLIADWQTDSVIFTVGSTLRSPALVGRAQGSTWAVVTSPIGTDSILVAVDSASVGLRLQTFTTYLVGDTLRTLVLLSEPAPPGGITAVVRATDPSKVQVSPWSGRGAPLLDCEFYCSALRAEPDGPAILAPPADSAFVTIPEGRLAGYVALFLLDSSLAANVTVRAPGYVSGANDLEVLPPTLTLFSNHTSFGSPLPIGAREELFVQLPYAPTSDRTIRLTARRPTSVRVDSLGIIRRGDFGASEINYDILAVDSSWVLVNVAGAPVDSFLVRGVAPTTMLAFADATVAPNELFTVDVGLVADTTAGPNYFLLPPRGVDTPLSIISRNPAVAAVDVGSSVIARGEYRSVLTVRAFATGTAWIVVAAQGAPADSLLVTVQTGILSVITNGTTIGSGLVHRNVFVSTSSSLYDPVTPVEVTVTSSDSSVVFVATPTIGIGSSGVASRSLLLVGRNIGTSNLTFSAPGFSPVVRTFVVSQPRFVIQTFATATTLDPDSLNRGIASTLSDASSFVRPSVDSVTAVLRSSNPAVVQVTDSLVRYNGNGNSFNGAVRAVGPGTAQLTLSAPGYQTATSGVITVRAPRLDITSASLGTGVGLRQVINVNRRALPGAPIPLTITIQGPAGVTPLVTADTIPANGITRPVFVNTGTILGSDTMIVSAPGLVPDTVVLIVGASRVSPSVATNALVGQDVDVTAFVRPVAAFSTSVPDVARRFVLSVRDTSIFSVVADTAEIEPPSANAVRFARVRARRPGSTYLRLTDPTGLFQTDSVLVGATTLQLGGNANFVVMGMREITDQFETYVYRDFGLTDSLWVRLVSSDPSLVQVQDSVLLAPGESFEYFQITSGDTVGAAYVTGSAPGYLPFRWTVNVARSQLVAFANGGALSLNNSRPISVYTRNASSGDARLSLDTIPVRIRTSNPAVVRLGADSIGAVMPMLLQTDNFGPLEGLALGTSIIDVEDLRTGLFRQLLPAREQAEVVPARLTTNRTAYTAAPGFITSANDYVQTGSAGDSAVVTATSLGGRVQVNPNPLIIGNFANTVNFSLSGVSLGVDTVVFSAPGYIPDTVQVRVGQGFLRINTAPPPRFFANESVTVSVGFFDPAMQGTLVGPNGVPLTFASTGQMSARSNIDGTALGTVPVPSGAFQYTFVLRAGSPGEGTVTLSAPGLAPLVMRFEVIARPE